MVWFTVIVRDRVIVRFRVWLSNSNKSFIFYNFAVRACQVGLSGWQTNIGM